MFRFFIFQSLYVIIFLIFHLKIVVLYFVLRCSVLGLVVSNNFI